MAEETGWRFTDDVLRNNLREIRRRRFWDRRYAVAGGLRGGEDDPGPGGEDLEQEHVAARMRDLGHSWVQQTVSEVERGRRRVTASELVSLTVVLGASVGDLLDPRGAALTIDPQGRVQVTSKDLAGLVCGHTRRATVEWGGEDLAELVGVEFRDDEAER
jgi:transcriptional regulator with XRE-family HTH domain